MSPPACRRAHLASLTLLYQSACMALVVTSLVFALLSFAALAGAQPASFASSAGGAGLLLRRIVDTRAASVHP